MRKEKIEIDKSIQVKSQFGRVFRGLPDSLKYFFVDFPEKLHLVYTSFKQTIPKV